MDENAGVDDQNEELKSLADNVIKAQLHWSYLAPTASGHTLGKLA